MVYAAQPREGTETARLRSLSLGRRIRGLCSSTPRGDGNSHSSTECDHTLLRFMQLNPARGRKLDQSPLQRAATISGLCSSTPRGDGNALGACGPCRRLCRERFMQLNPARGRKPRRLLGSARVRRTRSVYAAQPREGTETLIDEAQLILNARDWFMQLNPARGRKHTIRASGLNGSSLRFMQLNPARGRKLNERVTPSDWLNRRFMQLNPARGRKRV